MYQQTASVCLLIVSALSVQGQNQVNQEPQHGHWGEWTEASACTATCGEGSQKIIRFWIAGPADPPKAKDFTDTHVYSCTSPDHPECPTDGVWSGWYSTGDCSVMCGGGTRQQQRTCMGVTGAGKKCEGEKNKTVNCNKEPCPILPLNFDMNTCDADSFTCESNRMCVPSAQRCDTTLHCHDGTDEKDCPRRSRYRNTASPIFNFQWLLTATVTTVLAAILLH